MLIAMQDVFKDDRFKHKNSETLMLPSSASRPLYAIMTTDCHYWPQNRVLINLPLQPPYGYVDSNEVKQDGHFALTIFYQKKKHKEIQIVSL